jgi:quinol monooxygenase YgiN
LVIESIRIAVAPTKREQLMRALRAWSGPTGVESGCLSCRILQEESEPLAFCYQAQWKTQDDLLRHVRSEHYKRLLVLMDLGSEPPLVEFHTVSETKGMDLIQRARNAA